MRADKLSVPNRRLWEAYTKENYECLQRGDVEGCMYWSSKIEELLEEKEEK